MNETKIKVGNAVLATPLRVGQATVKIWPAALALKIQQERERHRSIHAKAKWKSMLSLVPKR